jgi:hypothetical protein
MKPKTETPLREKVAKAIWDAGECPMPWGKLNPVVHKELKAEMLEIADAALRVILEDVAIEEYERWRDTDEIGAIGACSNIVAKLIGVSEREATPNDPKLSDSGPGARL